jgi:hypothetical protein
MKLSAVTSFLILLLFVCPAARAGVEIFWGNNPGNGSNRIFDSAGNPAENNLSQFTFALGTFGNFVPTAANSDQWFANWKALDRVELEISDDWIDGVAILDNQSSFQIGEVAYQFIYRTEGSFVTEATLTTCSDWFIPNVLTNDGLQLTWTLDLAEEIAFGGVLGNSGPGSATPPAAFDIQTHRLANAIAAPIPEPTTTILVSGLVAALGARRRRKPAA